MRKITHLTLISVLSVAIAHPTMASDQFLPDDKNPNPATTVISGEQQQIDALKESFNALYAVSEILLPGQNTAGQRALEKIKTQPIDDKLAFWQDAVLEQQKHFTTASSQKAALSASTPITQNVWVAPTPQEESSNSSALPSQDSNSLAAEQPHPISAPVTTSDTQTEEEQLAKELSGLDLNKEEPSSPPTPQPAPVSVPPVLPDQERKDVDGSKGRVTIIIFRDHNNRARDETIHTIPDKNGNPITIADYKTQMKIPRYLDTRGLTDSEIKNIIASNSHISSHNIKRQTKSLFRKKKK
jgi:hypothetical protein